MLILNTENFEKEVTRSEKLVIVDLWGPKCGPCLALMPDVEAMAGEYTGKIEFGKINVMENRRLCIALKVMGVPTILFYKGGEQKERLTGEQVTIEAIRAGAKRLLAE
jgi:thioredoxin 1